MTIAEFHRSYPLAYAYLQIVANISPKNAYANGISTRLFRYKEIDDKAIPAIVKLAEDWKSWPKIGPYPNLRKGHTDGVLTIKPMHDNRYWPVTHKTLKYIGRIMRADHMLYLTASLDENSRQELHAALSTINREATTAR